jgi:hypothetical protein
MKVLWTTKNVEFLPKNEIFNGKIEIPKCQFCDSERVPEVQILPTSIYFLECGKNCHLKENDGLDFGTAVLYVCSQHCQKGKYVEEFILVQPPFF